MGGGEGMGLARRLALGSLAQLGDDTTLAAPKDCRLLAATAQVECQAVE